MIKNKKLFIPVLALAVLVVGTMMVSAMTRTPSVVSASFSCSEDFMLVQGLQDDRYYYVLNGMMDMPTPGYSYEIAEAPEDAEADFNVFFSAPEGIVTQVISPLEIRHDFLRDDVVDTVTYTLENAAEWQPKAIHCTRED